MKKILITAIFSLSVLSMATTAYAAGEVVDQKKTDVRVNFYNGTVIDDGPYSDRLMLVGVPGLFDFGAHDVGGLTTVEGVQMYGQVNPMSNQYVVVSDDRRTTEKLDWILSAELTDLFHESRKDDPLDATMKLVLNNAKNFTGMEFEPGAVIGIHDSQVTDDFANPDVVLADISAITLIAGSGSGADVLSATVKDGTTGQYAIAKKVKSNTLEVRDISDETVRGVYKGAVVWTLTDGI